MISKRTPVRLLAIMVAFASAFAYAEPPAVASPGVTGLWMGAMVQHGIAYRVVLHVTQDAGGKLAVSMESVEQHATLPGENAILKDGGFSFEIGKVGKYQGTLAADGNTMSGTWTQQGNAVPAQLCANLRVRSTNSRTLVSGETPGRIERPQAGFGSGTRTSLERRFAEHAHGRWSRHRRARSRTTPHFYLW
jgi:hypothetical protein